MAKLFSIDDFALESILEDHDHDAAEVVTDANELLDDTETAQDQSAQVTDLQEAVNILDQQTDISNEALEQFAILRDNVYRNLGMSPTTHPSYIRTATEDSSTKQVLKYALEQEKNFLQRAWDTVWTFLKKMWQKAVDFFKKLFGIRRKADKGLDATEELAKKFDDSTDSFFKEQREAWEKSMQDRKNRYDEQSNKIKEEHAEQVKRDNAERALKSEEKRAASKEAEEKELKELREKRENEQKQKFIKESIEKVIRWVPRDGVRLVIHRDLINKLPEKLKNIIGSSSIYTTGVNIKDDKKKFGYDSTRNDNDSEHLSQDEFKEIIQALSDYDIPPPKGEQYSSEDKGPIDWENEHNVIIVFALKPPGKSVEEEYTWVKMYSGFVVAYTSYLQKLNKVYVVAGFDTTQEYNPDGDNFKKYKKLAESLSTESDNTNKKLTPEGFKKEYMNKLNAAVTDGKIAIEESIRFINYVKSMLG